MARQVLTAVNKQKGRELLPLSYSICLVNLLFPTINSQSSDLRSKPIMLRAVNQAPEKWKPKQCVEVNSAVLSSQKIAKHIMGLLFPFPPGSFIHDNACGKGVISKDIIDFPPDGTQDISIHATDLFPAMVEECHALAAEKDGLGRHMS
jgi:hypothetical protein